MRKQNQEDAGVMALAWAQGLSSSYRAGGQGLCGGYAVKALKFKNLGCLTAFVSAGWEWLKF